MLLTRRLALLLSAMLFGAVAGVGVAKARAPQAAAAKPAAQQVVGTIKAINGRIVTITTDAGANSIAMVSDTSRILRVEPGQTDLKTAVPLTFADLQVGDRILVRGALTDDGSSLLASSVIAMKHADVQAKQQQILEDWQKRGVGGLVSAIDPATGIISISSVTATGPRTIAIHTTKDTILRRYAPDSVKFDDAQVGPITQIRVGDQLRARGARNTDSTEITADEIVSGSFRNISGTVDSVDAANNTLTVTDLVTKKPVVVKVTTQSQIRKLTPVVAQGLAARLKGPAAGAPAAGGNSPAVPGAGGQRPGGGLGGGPGGPGGNARSGGAAADFQQVVGRMPQITLAEFMKSDAVMIVSTSSANSAGVTAITLVGGVEPILAASPNGGQDVTLAPWSIGGGGDAGEGAPVEVLLFVPVPIAIVAAPTEPTSEIRATEMRMKFRESLRYLRVAAITVLLVVAAASRCPHKRAAGRFTARCKIKLEVRCPTLRSQWWQRMAPRLRRRPAAWVHSKSRVWSQARIRCKWP